MLLPAFAIYDHTAREEQGNIDIGYMNTEWGDLHFSLISQDCQNQQEHIQNLKI